MKKFYIFCLVVSVFLLNYCDRVKEPYNPCALDNYGVNGDKILSQDEYTLYRLVLNKIKPQGQQKVLVSDSTLFEDFTDRLDNIYEQIPELSPETVQNYFLKNQKKGIIGRLPFVNKKFLLVKWDNTKKVYVDANNHSYNLKDSCIYGIISLSYIGFNDSKTQAVVSVVDYGAPLVAVSYLVFFVKEKEWVIKKEILLWIS